MVKVLPLILDVDNRSKLVIVTGMTDKVTEKKLQKYLSKAKRGGPVAELKIDRQNNMAFVEFEELKGLKYFPSCLLH